MAWSLECLAKAKNKQDHHTHTNTESSEASLGVPSVVKVKAVDADKKATTSVYSKPLVPPATSLPQGKRCDLIMRRLFLTNALINESDDEFSFLKKRGGGVPENHSLLDNEST